VLVLLLLFIEFLILFIQIVGSTNVQSLFSARLKIPGKLRLSSSWQFYRRIVLSVFRILPGFWESPVHLPPSEEKNPKGFGKETKKQKMKDRKELPEN